MQINGSPNLPVVKLTDRQIAAGKAAAENSRTRSPRVKSPSSTRINRFCSQASSIIRANPRNRLNLAARRPSSLSIHR